MIITVAVVAVLAVLAIAGGALWLNSYIHSPAFKADVESRASQAVGGPVQIESIDFDIFHGVRLQGVVTQIDPSHAGGEGALKLQVASVNCGYSWIEILQGKLQVTGVTLDKPQVVLTKQPTAPLEQNAYATASTPSSPVSGGTSSGTSLPFKVALDRAKVSEGTLSICDAAGTSMVELKGVNASADTSGYFDGKDVTGTLKIADIAGSNLHLTDFSTPFTYHQGGHRCETVRVHPAFGGKIRRRLSSRWQRDLQILDLNANGLDVACRSRRRLRFQLVRKTLRLARRAKQMARC